MADQKTEKPTERRLKKAREKGQFAASREFVSALQFLAFVFVLSRSGREWWTDVQALAVAVFQQAFRETLTPERLTHLVWTSLLVAFVPLFKGGAILAIVTMGAQMAVTGFGFSLTRLAPKADNFNPIKRLTQLPKQNFQAVVQSLIVLALCGLVFHALARHKFEEMQLLPMGSLAGALDAVFNSFSNLLWTMAWGLVAVGAVDFIRQKAKFAKQMKMSRQEIRDEYKESEGSPQIKARRRRLQREQARRRMMKRVPQATVVVVNPTHFAVAIQYNSDVGGAPVVVAKGKNLVARTIRRIAERHSVPVVQNPPLAQALYKSVALGGEIPAALYRAVAELLAYVYKNLGRG